MPMYAFMSLNQPIYCPFTVTETSHLVCHVNSNGWPVLLLCYQLKRTKELQWHSKHEWAGVMQTAHLVLLDMFDDTYSLYTQIMIVSGCMLSTYSGREVTRVIYVQMATHRALSPFRYQVLCRICRDSFASSSSCHFMRIPKRPERLFTKILFLNQNHLRKEVKTKAPIHSKM